MSAERVASVLSCERRWGVAVGDCLDSLRTMPVGCVQCVVTSPPYFGLRSYLPKGHPDKAKEIGLEETPETYIARMVSVFREVRRVLRDDGVVWVNLGSSYASAKPSVRIKDRGDGLGESGGVRLITGANEPFALRDDLTPDEIAYVLSELVTHMGKGGEVAVPDIPV